jgi:hypothetical protein
MQENRCSPLYNEYLGGGGVLGKSDKGFLLTVALKCSLSS